MINELPDAKVVDEIYESAVNPEYWPSALSAIAHATESSGGVIFCTTAVHLPPSYRTTEQLAPMAKLFVESGQFRESVRAKIAFLDPFPEFAPTRNTTEGVGLDEDITTQMMAQVGLGEESTTHIRMPTGDMVTIGIQRAYGMPVHDAKQLARLNTLLPHLSRSAMIASRLRLEAARSTLEMLGAVAIPACVVARDGRVLVTNALFDQLRTVFLPAAFGGVVIADPVANRMFQEAIRVHGAGSQPFGSSIPVAKAPDREPAVIHLLPLLRSARDILSGGDMLVAVTTPAPRAGGSSPNILAALFDLTPAQARTAAALADGASVAAIAVRLGLTEKTVRTYIERIFAKTGTTRLGDLLILLSQFRQIGS